MIKFLLNHIPRPILQRMAGWAVPIVGLFYAIGRGARKGGAGSIGNEGPDAKDNGRGVQCPVCGARYRKFMPYGYVSKRKNALCPRCLALERHRLLWLWLVRETDLLPTTSFDRSPSKTDSCKACDGADGPDLLSSYAGENDRESQSDRVEKQGVYSGLNDEHDDANVRSSRQILHIAPEVCLMRKFEKIFPADRYITLDLESPLAKVHADVQALPFPDNSFDVIFCNHILEHVADDRLAMREMYRVMRPGDWGVMLSPVDEARAGTFEDDTITDPAERTRIFGQYDHRRIYGRDYADRLRGAGWQVDEIDYFHTLPPEERDLYALRPEILYIVRKK